jgi:uncharacterized protein (TIGR02246 family)
MKLRQRAAVVLAAVAAISSGLVAGSPAPASQGKAIGCERQFHEAVRTYVATTDARDAEGFNALLHPDVTAILPGGTVIAGKQETAAFVRQFFARTDWTQSLIVTRTSVQGCATAFVLFDSVYAEPATGYQDNLMIGITWTRERGRWLVLHDQNTVVG